MPNAGDIVDAYNRQYKFIKPQSTDPGTFRLATPPDAVHGGGGSGGGGGSTVVSGIDPIMSDQPTPSQATVSLDITSLPYV